MNTCTMLEDGKPCGEPVLVPDVCYDHAVIDPDDIEQGPADPRKIELREKKAEATR